MASLAEDSTPTLETVEEQKHKEQEYCQISLWETPLQRNLHFLASLYTRFLLVAVTSRHLEFSRGHNFFIIVGLLVMATWSLVPTLTLELLLKTDQNLFIDLLSIFSLLSCMNLVSLSLKRYIFTVTIYSITDVAAVCAILGALPQRRLILLRWDALITVITSAFHASIWYFLHNLGKNGTEEAFLTIILILSVGACIAAALKVKFPEKVTLLPHPQKFASLIILIQMCFVIIATSSRTHIEDKGFSFIFAPMISGTISLLTLAMTYFFSLCKSHQDELPSIHWELLLLTGSMHLLLLLWFAFIRYEMI